MTKHQLRLNDQQYLAIECLAEATGKTFSQVFHSIIANAVTGIRRDGRSEADFIRYCYGDAADDARRAYYRKGGE